MTIGRVLFGLILYTIGAIAGAQEIEHNTYTLSGTVKEVDINAKTIVVTNQPIPGSMGAMTMTYNVNDPVLSRVKPGDRINAKLRESDQTLYDVQIIMSLVSRNWRESRLLTTRRSRRRKRTSA
jgi:Cu/Ag efflux protein CusF